MSHAYRYDSTELIKSIPIQEVYRHYAGGELRQAGNRLYGRCPLHEDKKPSLVIYQQSNSFFCFSCQTGGDGIDLVKSILNVGFKEAVSVLSQEFGITFPTTKAEMSAARSNAAELRRRRELEARFRKREDQAYRRIAALLRRICYLADAIHTDNDLDKLGHLYHTETLADYYLEILQTGTVEEKFSVLASDKVRRWCRWQ